MVMTNGLGAFLGVDTADAVVEPLVAVAGAEVRTGDEGWLLRLCAAFGGEAAATSDPPKGFQAAGEAGVAMAGEAGVATTGETTTGEAGVATIGEATVGEAGVESLGSTLAPQAMSSPSMASVSSGVSAAAPSSASAASSCSSAGTSASTIVGG